MKMSRSRMADFSRSQRMRFLQNSATNRHRSAHRKSKFSRSARNCRGFALRARRSSHARAKAQYRSALRRDPKDFRRLGNRQPGKEPQLDQFGDCGSCGRQTRSRASSRASRSSAAVRDGDWATQVRSGSVAAMFAAIPSPGVLNKDPPHGFRRGRKEMPAVVPKLRRRHSAHKPQISLVDQRRRLQRLARLLSRESRGSESTKPVVNQGKQPLGSIGITLLNLGDNLSDVRHEHATGSSWPVRMITVPPVGCADGAFRATSKT